jgi:predicted membrane channel-forming protein YqfA (hemolysin III family)
MRGNRFILSGYRLNHSTYSDTIWSLFTVHNESVNVWSHVLGAKLFIGMIIYLSFFKKEDLWNPFMIFSDMFSMQEPILFDLDKESIIINGEVPTCKLSS